MSTLQKREDKKTVCLGEADMVKAPPLVLAKKKAKKKRIERNQNDYSVPIYKIMKQIHPELGVSKKAMSLLNSMLYCHFLLMQQMMSDQVLSLMPFSALLKRLHNCVHIVTPKL